MKGESNLADMLDSFPFFITGGEMVLQELNKTKKETDFIEKEENKKQINKNQIEKGQIKQIDSKNKTGYLHVQHDFLPIYNEYSRILILGSFPSVKSREGQFYYHHPQNRFWKLISQVFEEELPKTINEKKNLLFRNKIALWDVIENCDIIGSSDSSIKNVKAADIGMILKTAQIQAIYTNGGKANDLYIKYCEPLTKVKAIKLPSTSPANAAWNLEKLMEAWKVIKIKK